MSNISKSREQRIITQKIEFLKMLMFRMNIWVEEIIRTFLIKNKWNFPSRCFVLCNKDVRFIFRDEIDESF